MACVLRYLIKFPCDSRLVKNWINIINKDNSCLFEVLNGTIRVTDLIGRENVTENILGLCILFIIPSGGLPRIFCCPLGVEQLTNSSRQQRNLRLVTATRFQAIRPANPRIEGQIDRPSNS